jgi:hypothetical protein
MCSSEPNILTKCPDCDRTPHHLKYPSVDRECKSNELSDKSDHVGPKSKFLLSQDLLSFPIFSKAKHALPLHLTPPTPCLSTPSCCAICKVEIEEYVQ